MKILEIVFNLAGGGAEKFTVDLSNELSKSNEVYLCVIEKEDMKSSFFKRQLNSNVKYINLGRSKGLNLISFFTIFRLIKKLRPNVVHVHLNTKLYAFIPSLFYRNQIKYFNTIHSLANKDVGFKWQRKINNIFYKHGYINAVTISKECNESFVNYYGHDNVLLVENGVSSPTPSNKFYKVREEISQLKRKASDLVIIHVGRFSKEKNQKLLINGFNRFSEMELGAILIVLGSSYDSLEAKELKEISNMQIHYLGLKKNVTDYLLNSDIFVLSSIWEGLPISLIEAISCGVIPVCTPAGGIVDVIKDETIGYLSKDFTEKGLCDSLINCRNNMENFDRRTLHDYYKTFYSIEKCAVEYLKIFNSN